MNTTSNPTCGLQPWKLLLAGISHTVGFASEAFGIENRERQQSMTAIRIALDNPKISFFTTRPGGERDTLGARLDDFLRGRRHAVGINANFCWPDFEAFETRFGRAGNYRSRDVPYKLFGLAISEGELVSSLDTVPSASYPGSTALMIDKQNNATIRCVTRDFPPPPETWTAVAGGPQPARPKTETFAPALCPSETVGGPLMVIEGGRNMAKPALIPYEAVAARTAIGLSKDRRTMFWITIDDLDDYNPDNPDVDLSTPQIGAAFYDVGEWLLMLGAHDGMTLDGGKSTAMARTDENGDVKLMNTPRPDPDDLDAVEQLRCVGNFLGVQSAQL